MVSIGKLGKGQEEYYLEQAHGRIDRVTSVSSGVEDYYVAGAEPDGVWLGNGRSALGLSGSVTAAKLRRVLEGCHPRSGEPLGRRAAVVGGDRQDGGGRTVCTSPPALPQAVEAGRLHGRTGGHGEPGSRLLIC
jgi:hypothetical protein